MSLQINLEDRHLVILGGILLLAIAVRLAIGATGVTPLNPGHPLSQTWIDTDLNMSKYNVTSMGKVGIGTTNPAMKLDVYGVVQSMTDSTHGVQLWPVSNSLARVNAYTGMDLGLSSGGVDRILIKSNGNVGIGTTAPARNLHVIGTGISISNDATDKSSIYWDAANSRLVIKVS